MTRNIIGNKYQIQQILFEDSGYCAAVCMNISAFEPNQTYLLNIYKEKPLIQMALPIFSRVSSETCSSFCEYFVDSPYVVAVFTYHPGTYLKDYTILKDFTVNKRISLAVSYLLECVKTDNVPGILKYQLFNPDFIIMDDSGSVRFNFQIGFDAIPENKGTESTWNKLAIQELVTTLNLLLSTGMKPPKEFTPFLAHLTEGKYDAVSTIYTQFKALADNFLLNPDDKNLKMPGLDKKKFLDASKERMKHPAIRRTLGVLAVLVLTTGLILGGHYAYKFYRSTIPVIVTDDNPTETQLVDKRTFINGKLAATSPAPTPKAPAQIQEPGEFVHLVNTGDSLYWIALKYYGNGELYPVIYKRNNLTSITIYSGMQLYIPANPYQ